MEFRQPNDLSRALERVLTDMLQGKPVSFRFSSETQLQHVLAVLKEVATSRQVMIQVRPVGRRTLELTLAEAPAPAPV